MKYSTTNIKFIKYANGKQSIFTGYTGYIIVTKKIFQTTPEYERILQICVFNPFYEGLCLACQKPLFEFFDA
jgi:uncharacterized protein Usg